MNVKTLCAKVGVFSGAVALLAGGMAMASVDAASAPLPVAAKSATATTVFRVPSMSCGDKACETAIYIALHRLKGVEKIRIDDMARTVTVTYDPEDVNAATMLQTMQGIGYPASVQQPG